MLLHCVLFPQHVRRLQPKAHLQLDMWNPSPPHRQQQPPNPRPLCPLAGQASSGRPWRPSHWGAAKWPKCCSSSNNRGQCCKYCLEIILNIKQLSFLHNNCLLVVLRLLLYITKTKVLCSNECWIWVIKRKYKDQCSICITISWLLKLPYQGYKLFYKEYLWFYSVKDVIHKNL